METIPQRRPDNPPIYDIDKTYEENFVNGPFFQGEIPRRKETLPDKWVDFLEHKVMSPLGVPAGPLLNSKWVILAAKLGFDIVTYKTIRSDEQPCQPPPNMIYVETNGPLTKERFQEKLRRRLTAPADMNELAVTNSFGMPSQGATAVMEDITRANSALYPGQVMIVSVVGTHRQGEDFIKDFCRAAAIAKEAGARLVEANFSCPNVTTGEGSIYTNPDTVGIITAALARELKDIPLIIKAGYFIDFDNMRQVFVAAARAGARAVCGINTIGMEVINENGEPALGQGRLKSGICGRPIQTAALEFVRNAKKINEREKLGLAIMGVGGVTLPEDFDLFFAAGADIAMSATGMMWDPYLAMSYHETHKS